MGEWTGTQHTMVNIWARMLRNGTRSYAEFVKERNWGDFNRQVWWVVVNIQNTSTLLQRARWDTLLLSHPHPSEPKEVYQYLDALEVGRFELHVPVSGDLKENKKQGIKHHNSEISSCSYSTEKGTQWPSIYPEGWELLEHDCLPKPHSHFRQGLCSWGCRGLLHPLLSAQHSQGPPPDTGVIDTGSPVSGANVLTHRPIQDLLQPSFKRKWQQQGCWQRT